jgi:hypothetical protein
MKQITYVRVENRDFLNKNEKSDFLFKSNL